MKTKTFLVAGGLVLLLTIPASAQRRGIMGRGYGGTTAGNFGNVGPYGYGYGTGNSFNNFGVPYSSSYGYNGYGYNGYNTSPGLSGYNNFGNNRFNNNQWQSVPGTNTWQSGYTPNTTAVPGASNTTQGTTGTVQQASATGKMGLVITELKDNGMAKEAGLRRGDVILSIDGKRTQMFDDLRTALTSTDKKEVKVEFIDGSNGQTETKKVMVRDSKIGVTVEETAVNR